MDEKIKQIMTELQAKFEDEDIIWKPANFKQPNGLKLPYLRKDAIMQRLDDVVGVDGWWRKFTPIHFDSSEKPGFFCELTLVINGVEITKTDAAEQTNIAPLKGGLSDAFKRAAMAFGIGRFLTKMNKKQPKSNYKKAYTEKKETQKNFDTNPNFHKEGGKSCSDGQMKFIKTLQSQLDLGGNYISDMYNVKSLTEINIREAIDAIRTLLDMKLSDLIAARAKQTNIEVSDLMDTICIYYKVNKINELSSERGNDQLGSCIKDLEEKTKLYQKGN